MKTLGALTAIPKPGEPSKGTSSLEKKLATYPSEIHHGKGKAPNIPKLNDGLMAKSKSCINGGISVSLFDDPRVATVVRDMTCGSSLCVAFIETPSKKRRNPWTSHILSELPRSECTR